MPRPTLPALVLLCGLAPGLSPARALTLPMSGWTPASADRLVWTDDAGACTLREDRSAQKYSDFADRDAALTFAARLQAALSAQTIAGPVSAGAVVSGPSGGPASSQKLAGVVAQPVERAGRWTVLAAYRFQQDGTDYDVTQLYLSDGGRLRTVTGSSAAGEVRGCVVQMREFVRYLAN